LKAASSESRRRITTTATTLKPRSRVKNGMQRGCEHNWLFRWYLLLVRSKVIFLRDSKGWWLYKKAVYGGFETQKVDHSNTKTLIFYSIYSDVYACFTVD